MSSNSHLLGPYRYPVCLGDPLSSLPVVNLAKSPKCENDLGLGTQPSWHCCVDIAPKTPVCSQEALNTLSKPLGTLLSSRGSSVRVDSPQILLSVSRGKGILGG